MKKSSKTEIVISTWEGRSGPSYWGDTDCSGYDDQATSLWLPLRGVVPDDSYINDNCRAMGNIGLYVWVSTDGTVSIDLRLHDVGSITLHEGEHRIKVLKRLLAKGTAYPFSNFKRGTGVHAELTRAADALGIKRALVYHGINQPEMFEPVGIAIKRISDCIDSRLARMKQRQVA